MNEEILHFDNAREAQSLTGQRGEWIPEIERTFGVQLTSRDAWIALRGPEASTARAASFLTFLRRARSQGATLRDQTLRYTLQAYAEGREQSLERMYECRIPVAKGKLPIFPRTFLQQLYVEAIRDRDIVFGLGPAGTGKTYLAMATAVSTLLEGSVSRIILTRPAIEAGEALGFLPGDMHQKVLPYLRPLYDALYDMMPPEEIERNMDRGVIEVAPLAYMRGRTLNHAFVILDEAQNTTPEQMLMFLTRLGFDSKCVITGDLTQIDLPANKLSGLQEARHTLRDIPEIAFIEFGDRDVVRHELVQKVIQAYRLGRSNGRAPATSTQSNSPTEPGPEQRQGVAP